MDNLERFLDSALGVTVFLIVALWSVVWKGFALYRAGSLRDRGWFIALFLINTAGILEILYLTVFQHRKSRR